MLGSFFKKNKHRKFTYEPRYYNPLEDEEERRKRRLGFQSSRNKHLKRKSPLVTLLVILVIIYVIIQLAGFG